MERLGEWLRAAREAKGLSLEDVESVTRIRVRYLKALEAGDYGAMSGGEPQVRGFLRRYAAVLGLSPDEAIARYERERHGEAGGPPSHPSAPSGATLRPIDVTPSRPAILPVLVGVGIVVILALAGWWLLSGPGALSLPSAAPTPSSQITRVPLTPRPTEPQPTAQPTPTFPVSASGGVTLTLEPLEHVWVRVTTDGLTAFEGMLSPGAPQTWVAQELVVAETGNGAGVVAIVNGQRQGPLGKRGELCTRAWGPQGEVALPSAAASSGEESP